MAQIFISYRRDDSAGHAGRLFDHLRHVFGEEAVFIDVARIAPGADFADALDQAVSSCDVVLVLIGAGWLACEDEAGRRRLDDPQDHLRLEVARALRSDVVVIPVLLRGARMPAERDLPEELRSLARRQAIEITDSRWDYDVEQLARSIERSVRAGAGPARPAPGKAAPPPRTRAILGVAAALLVAGVLASGPLREGCSGAPEVAPPPAGHAGQAAPPPKPESSGAPARDAPRQAAPVAVPLPGTDEVRAGPARFKVVRGLLVREPTGIEAATAELRLLVRTTNVAARSGFNLSGNRSFRLIAGDATIEPDEAPISVVSMQSAAEDTVVFRVPAAADAAFLSVGVPGEGTGRIRIDLRARSDAPMRAHTWRSPADARVGVQRRVGGLSYVVESVRLEHLSDAFDLVPEKLQLVFTVRLSNVGAPSGYAVGPGDFRLVVDGVPLEPARSPIEVVDHRSSLDATVEFVMPATAGEVLLQLGDVGGETVRVPIDLSPFRT